MSFLTQVRGETSTWINKNHIRLSTNVIFSCERATKSSISKGKKNQKYQQTVICLIFLFHTKNPKHRLFLIQYYIPEFFQICVIVQNLQKSQWV